MRDDEDQIEDRARADRGDYGYALGRGGDFRLRLGVERPEQRAFGDVDEVAAVDDRARGFQSFGPCARRLRPLFVERDQPAYERAGEFAIVRRAGPRERRVQFRDPALPHHRGDFASREAQQADHEKQGEGGAEPAERSGPREQSLDEVARPEPQSQRNEPAKTRRGQRAQGRPPAASQPGILRRLDLAFGLVERFGAGRGRKSASFRNE